MRLVVHLDALTDASIASPRPSAYSRRTAGGVPSVSPHRAAACVSAGSRLACDLCGSSSTLTHSLMHPSLRRGRWYRLRVAAPRHGMHPCGGGSSSRHCGRRPSPARHTPPRGGGSSSRQRPMQCCSVPRCPASTDTAAGDHRLPTTLLLAAVGRRPDNAPCSVARRHAVRRQQTLRPATIACSPTTPHRPVPSPPIRDHGWPRDPQR